MRATNYISNATVVTSGLMLFENTYRNFSCPRHFHETYQFEIIKKGKKQCFCKGRNYNNIGRGSMIMVNPGEIHTGGTAGNGELVCIAFYPEADAWQTIIGESFEAPETAKKISNFKSTVASDNKIVDNVQSLYNLIETREVDFLAQELFQQIMVDLLTKHSTSHLSLDENFQRYAQAMARASEYINDNIGDKLLLEDIAKAAFISPFHFLRIFRNLTGMTLHQYILSLRIERAKALLLQQKDSISNTFSQVGFANQTHFTKVFKKITGLTPKQYKDIVRN